MKISVCIDALFNGQDFIQSIKALKNAGITSFEFWSWWNKDIQQIKKVKDEFGMEVVTFCTKMVSLVDDTKREEYITGLKDSIKVAKELGCKKLITQVGGELKNKSREEQHESLVAGLKACVPVLEESDIIIVFEPLNTTVDHKGYYLYSSDEAFQIVDEVGSKNVKVLFDIYHQQIMEGNLISTISKNIDKIGHFHAAGVPGRHELYIGEINYTEVFKAIDDTGYGEYVGLEYFPLEDPVSGLKRGGY